MAINDDTGEDPVAPGVYSGYICIELSNPEWRLNPYATEEDGYKLCDGRGQCTAVIHHYLYARVDDLPAVAEGSILGRKASVLLEQFIGMAKRTISKFNEL